MQKNLSLSCIYKKKVVSLRRIKLIPIVMNVKKTIVRAVVAGLLAALGIVAAAVGLQSCNVTRVITNESKYYQRGDTSIVIQTKVTETYDASKK